MKRFVIIFISLIVGYALYWCISDYNYRYNKINSIVGIYKLDFNHTDSEIYKDSIEKYNNLRLIFNSDMTFSLSFSVPFMADTVGTWKVGGMDEWNEIVYHNGIIDQLGEFDDGDTIIYINSPTPQKTYKKPTLIDKVFFVRLQDLDLFIHELKSVLVARDDKDLITLLLAARRQRADHIIGFVARFLIDRQL